MDRLTDGGRVLTPDEQVLADYLGNERQAIALAPHVDLAAYWDDPNDGNNLHLLAQAVTRALVWMYEARHGKIDIEYCGGERRDTLREK